MLPPWLIIGVVVIAIVGALFAVGKLTGGTNTPPPTHPSATTPAPHHTRRRHRPGHRAPAKPRTVRLQLTATGQVYVCLIDGGGAKLIPGLIFTAGQPIPVKTAPEAAAHAGQQCGDHEGQRKTVPVTASSGSIGYELLPGATRVLPTARQPRCA